MDHSKSNNILIIGVIYNNHEQVYRHLNLLTAIKQHNMITLCLVDNSERGIPPDFESKLENSPVNVFFFKTGKNLGYFGGAAYGLDQFLKNNPMPEWVIVSNIDLEYIDTDIVEKLEILDESSKTIIAPSIYSKTCKNNKNPFLTNRLSHNQVKFYKKLYKHYWLFIFYFLASFLKSYAKGLIAPKRDISTLKAKKIYAVHGAFIILNKIYFEKGGDLNHVSFLFGEEIFVAETAERIGLETYFVPDIKIVDMEHQSIGFIKSRKTVSYLYKSMFDIEKNFYERELK